MDSMRILNIYLTETMEFLSTKFPFPNIFVSENSLAKQKKNY